MATLTAVAAGGNWSSASTWSPAQVPTAADNCKITGTMTGTVTIDGTAGSPNLCRSLDCTGATHTLSQVGVLNIGDGSGGLLKLVAGMTYSISARIGNKFCLQYNWQQYYVGWKGNADCGVQRSRRGLDASGQSNILHRDQRRDHIDRRDPKCWGKNAFKFKLLLLQ